MQPEFFLKKEKKERDGGGKVSRKAQTENIILFLIKKCRNNHIPSFP